ncbi:MAG: DUF1361 domain-containing protein [Ardenticatenaceae bacterium]|nr:DUF1361 domain-containing protein [Ardenticatenaceae bacterium]
MLSKQLLTNHKARITAALLLASGLSVSMLAVRISYAGYPTYIFLVWNLFLAWLPFLLALMAYELRQRLWLLLPLGSLWLLFLPNAPYMITDLMHLHISKLVPVWYDAIMIFSFALTGLLLGFLSLYLMQALVVRRFGWRVGWLFVVMILGLSGLGVYIGRFLRWNSWDVFTNPLTVLHSLLNPELFLKAFVVTALLSLISIFAYVIMVSMPRLSLELARE